jgi:general secretion pathway protein A
VTATGTSTIFQHMFRSFGLNENPFHVSPDPKFLFSGAAYETALAELMFGIESRRGLLVLTGEAGTGKTTLMRHFLHWLKDRQFSSSYIFHSHLDPRDLFEFVLRDFGVAAESTKKSDLLATLHHWLHSRQTEGDSPVIVIDEAQALSLRTLSELNLLLNLENTRGKLVQIVLAGQPELEEKLRCPESRALRQRIMVRCRLPLLSLEETEEYIDSRLRGAGGATGFGAKVFPAQTVQTIYSYARGVPRVTNLLCEQAMIGAYADRQAVVSPQNVRRAAAEFDLEGAPFDVERPQVVPRETCATPGPDPAVWLREVPPPEIPVPADQIVEVATPSMWEPAREPASEVPGRIAAPVSAVPVTVQPEMVQVPMLNEELAAASIVEPTQDPASEVPVVVVATPVSVAPIMVQPEMVQAPAMNQEVAGERQPVLSSEEHAPERSYAWRKRRALSPFQAYWRDVADSFVRDWRQFFVSLSPQTATFPRVAVPRTDSIRRTVIEPIRNWLNKPIDTHVARTTLWARKISKFFTR